jgi:hypothetical protein
LSKPRTGESREHGHGGGQKLAETVAIIRVVRGILLEVRKIPQRRPWSMRRLVTHSREATHAAIPADGHPQIQVADGATVEQVMFTVERPASSSEAQALRMSR